MALLFCDGFDSYAATADLTKKWFSVNEVPWAWHATNGRLGTGCIQAATTGAGRLRIPVQLASGNNLGAVFSHGFWLKVSAAPASTSPLLRTLEIGLTTQQSLRINTSGFLALHDINGTLVSGVTGTTNVCDNAWHWVEWYCTHHSLFVTTCKCYVDSIVQWNGSVAPGGLNIDWIEFVSITGVTISIDDFIFWNDVGTDLNAASFPIGAKTIATLRPTSDSAVQFTRSTGSDNYALVDEVNPSMTDYVESGTSGQQDLYGYGDIGYTPTSVTAVMLNTYLYNPNAGTINFRAQAKSSATTRDGTSTIVPSSARLYQEAVHKDPNGTIAWTGSAVDAATFGVKVV